jgi:predicted P-loop ATPase
MDVNELAHHLVEVSTSENGDTLPATKAQISAFMAELGRKGGKIGGKRRLETMTAKKRTYMAKKAAEARWIKHKRS